MDNGIIVSSTLSSILINWTFITLDARGRSGECALGINNRTTRMINCWGREGVLGMDINISNSETPFTLINVYRPCSNRRVFWHSLLNFSLFDHPHVIMGGDLNFSLGISESWGTNAIPNPLADYIITSLEQVDLIDMQMPKLLPTWRNHRTGDAALARRLDIFLITLPLLQSLEKFQQWVGHGSMSDHSPVFLDFEIGPKHARPPFKFNSIWLLDPKYQVVQEWQHYQ